MRNRHTPRICRHCHAPMASGADICWHCGVQWAPEDAPATTLRLVPDEQPSVPDQRVAAAVAARS